MRPLDEKETTAVFEKLHKFTGTHLKHIVERPALEGETNTGANINSIYCFRLHKNKVFYASSALVRRATNISREKLVSLGTCIGKFTKGGSFRLTVRSLDLLAAHARRKVWPKPTAETAFLYGNRYDN